MAFSQVREYQPGDDIRSIDWNVTARFNHPFVKVFEEERELTVILLVDVSASGAFGTKKMFKQELITELCAVLSFSALLNNDKIGLILFSDQIEKFIPPKKGKTHILRIIRELLELEPQSRKTDISYGLRYLSNVIKKRSIVFAISDFEENRPGLQPSFEDALKVAGKKHDTIAIRIQDERESHLVPMGLVRVVDAETGKMMWVDTSSISVRNRFAENAKRKEEALQRVFAKCGVDTVRIFTDRSYVQPLMALFKRRGKRA